MSCFDKEHYKELKVDCEAAGIYVYTEEETESDKYNGISVAFAQVAIRPDARMLEIAVSYCSPEDEYKKKHGKYQALLHFVDGRTVQMPLNDKMYIHGPEYVGSYLVGIFSLL